ncbi:MAG: ectoine hydroxylase-related dioxygenase (phytanoyl-CoA dioxygenase family) [Mariniblastus sp.]|jgi:ectoine hydroxylase-related dioxygenase (phytanoyl-CoA dioxygenase family)
MTFQINDEQLNRFHEDGFLIVRQLFDEEETRRLMRLAKSDRAIMQEAYAKKDASGGESKLAVRNTLDESPYSAIVRCRRVAGSMQALLGDEVYHYHHKMMLKEPLVGGAWEWHQDYGYWYNNGCLYPDMGSCLVAVDRAIKKNGCLQVIRGSQKMGRIEHVKTGDQTGADLDRVQAALERMELVYCELEPGDAIFFHGNTLHRSDQNTSDDPRWSLICCFNTRHNDPYLKGKHPGYHPLELLADDQVASMLKASIDEPSDLEAS